jgi:hypothetical protein
MYPADGSPEDVAHTTGFAKDLIGKYSIAHTAKEEELSEIGDLELILVEDLMALTLKQHRTRGLR